MTTTIAPDATLVARPAEVYATEQASGLRLFDTFGYSYDGDGNITAIGSDAYVYDSRSRLTQATLFTTQNYGYDQYGNMLSKGGTTYCTGSCPNNRIPSAGYDTRGNLTYNPFSGGESYGYDGLDRLTLHQGSFSWSYLYDGDNERVVKIPPSGGVWTYTFRDEGKRVSTEFAGAVQSRDNVYLGNQLVASYANGAVGGNGPVWSFYSSDHLGSPRLIADVTGGIVETRRYWPYGEDATITNTFQRVRFAAMERDTEASRYHDHARGHEFNLGRFLGTDRVKGKPDDPQTWNRYVWARNNPVKYVDSDGLEFEYPGQQAELNRVKQAQFVDRLIASAQPLESTGVPGETLIYLIATAGLAGGGEALESIAGRLAASDAADAVAQVTMNRAAGLELQGAALRPQGSRRTDLSL